MTDKSTNPTTAPVVEGTPSNSTPPKKKASRLVTPILAGVVLLGAGIFGGVLIGQATATSSTPSPAGFGNGDFPTGGDFPAGGAQGGTAGPGNFTTGTVATNDDGTLTITTTDGTVTVTTGDDTTVTTTTEGSVADLAEGDTVTIIGATDDDGNVTATTITEGQTGFGGGGFPGGGVPTGGPSDN